MEQRRNRPNSDGRPARRSARRPARGSSKAGAEPIPAARPRVLVTRPEPGASKTAARIEALGYRPVLLPLTATLTLPVHVDTLGRGCDALAVTSAAALRHAPPALVARLRGVPAYCVGAETARAAAALGLVPAWTGTSDAAELAGAIIGAVPPPATIAYLTGKVRMAAIGATLEGAGLGVETIETYDTQALDYAADDLDRHVAGEPLAAILLYSAIAAERLSALPFTQDHRRMIAASRLLCLSRRIADAVDPALAGVKDVAARPDEAALLDLLVSRAP